jgi:acyl-CoA thioester hydrolase
VAESACTYFRSVAFPESLEIGLSVIRLGRSSVTYRLGLFRKGEETTAAICHFVHVYVDRKSNQSVPIPADYRALFESVQVRES